MDYIAFKHRMLHLSDEFVGINDLCRKDDMNISTLLMVNGHTIK